MSSLVLGLALVAGAPALKEPPPKGPPFLGRWIEVGDSALEYEFTPSGEWIISRNGKVIDQTARTYRLDKEAGAAAIDLTETPSPYPGVFKVEGDTLTLSFRYGGTGGRPADVTVKDTGVMTLTFQRAKKD